MKSFESLSLRYQDNKLQILNQKVLPHKEEWVEIFHPKDMIHCIKELKVRGAPLIGVSASLSLAQFLSQGALENEFKEQAFALRNSRPTAVNLMVCIDQLLDYETFQPEALIEKAFRLFEEDVALCDAISHHGAQFIEDGDSVLTHCNTGGLATVGSGTALGVIAKAYEQGKKIHVYVDETRPLLQGGRLTTYELEKLGIPYTLICDNMAAFLMAQGKISKAITGSDRIALNGDFANKIGTYNVAVLCHYHKIPFYVAAPYTTVDFDCKSGASIPIEERQANEVRGVTTHKGETIWSPVNSCVYNPSFDVTPAELVDRWILDTGAYTKEDIRNNILIGLKHK